MGGIYRPGSQKELEVFFLNSNMVGQKEKKKKNCKGWLSKSRERKRTRCLARKGEGEQSLLQTKRDKRLVLRAKATSLYRTNKKEAALEHHLGRKQVQAADHGSAN